MAMAYKYLDANKMLNGIYDFLEVTDVKDALFDKFNINFDNIRPQRKPFVHSTKVRSDQMSKDNVKKMFGKMEKDAEMKKKYAGLMLAHQKDAENKMAELLIEFGKTSGFAFSKEDLLAARAEVLDKVNSNNELSDGDLTNVAGGICGQKIGAIMASVITVGLVCAVVSAIFEGLQKGDCGRVVSTNDKC